MDGVFALATEESILEFSVHAAKVFSLGFEVLGPMRGASVLSLPISDLLPRFEVLTPRITNFLARLEHFAAKLPHRGFDRESWPRFAAFEGPTGGRPG